ncbi:metal-dependent hydrolase [Nocardiopsis sp. DSM 44743]|uniref:Metal-dependent hydrolase n=1 Tax=Nocardiopsis lambiniae TaxID=3075539 RepID=A0ABU2MGS3_9ACTN|nr:metal-dependent hydrolase [Nocardiopsis sp. DSM 44743]
MSERNRGRSPASRRPLSLESPMMGTSHAATGLLTGVMAGLVFGSHEWDVLVCAAVGAGAALLPDLDEPGSTAGRSLGPVTEGVSRLLRAVSQRVYRATGTPGELAAGRDGGHRHLTHTLPAVLVFGLLAWGVSASAPFGTGLVVFALSALGLGTLIRPMRWAGSRRRRSLAASVVALVFAGAAVVSEGGAPWLVGLTVGVGALTHLLGDWLTKSGVPLAWPFTVRGKRWWMFHSPVPFRTGESMVENAIRWGCLVGSPAIVALTWG